MGIERLFKGGKVDRGVEPKRTQKNRNVSLMRVDPNFEADDSNNRPDGWDDTKTWQQNHASMMNEAHKNKNNKGDV
jgi:hypothetical protein